MVCLLFVPLLGTHTLWPSLVLGQRNCWAVTPAVQLATAVFGYRSITADCVVGPVTKLMEMKRALLVSPTWGKSSMPAKGPMK